MLSVPDTWVVSGTESRRGAVRHRNRSASQHDERRVGAYGRFSWLSAVFPPSCSRPRSSWLDGTSSFTDDLSRILGSVSTADVQNLTVSAVLMKLMKTGGAGAGQVRQLLDRAGELGLPDMPLAALNGSVKV